MTNNCVPIEITNFSGSTIRVEPSEIVCELQHAEVECLSETPSDTSSTEPNDFLSQFQLPDILTEEEKTKAQELLLEFQDVFSTGDMDIGRTNLMKHNILLKDDIPFQQRHRRIPPALYQEAKDHLQQLLHAGVIRQSSSPYASAVVLVRKKNGKLRFCVDFRELNAKTVRDSYALQRIDELLDNLSGCRYFSTLDMLCTKRRRTTYNNCFTLELYSGRGQGAGSQCDLPAASVNNTQKSLNG